MYVEKKNRDKEMEQSEGEFTQHKNKSTNKD